MTFTCVIAIWFLRLQRGTPERENMQKFIEQYWILRSSQAVRLGVRSSV